MAFAIRAARAAFMTTALAATALAVPQAVAADASTGSPVQISAPADGATRAVAAEDPQAVRAAATRCGSGYKLYVAERLPDATRLGTLFTYTKDGSSGLTGVCAIFDNNTGAKQYMKLKLCPNRTNPTCDTEEGTFSQYAGPVYVTSPKGYLSCSKVTAIMKSGGATVINRVMTATPCD
ncbi:hypothetical protein AQI88_37620 [Streptomyces cellostaticus]|uniref:Serine/threonine protein kinase n=1 Tax=Streptomyces cellostaticus TaxID=67285 RepID=A0A124HBH5_9ACTN|nr:hypothetical protein [Streptomyces cellostaticus]KUM91251.1 hypothetical protein AQI88_37620 [Streptomyces cellostaticus]GHI09469.1 hypothetical protein Scel_77900 [Streptomyces cellostaticus]